MIGLQLEVPIASWRRGAAREFLETEVIPSPSTCYGALLSLVGEEDRDRHRGCRVTSGLVGEPAKSTVFRCLWQVKKPRCPAATRRNIGPDLQELLTGLTVLVWCEGSEERLGRDARDARSAGAGGARAVAAIRRVGTRRKHASHRFCRVCRCPSDRGHGVCARSGGRPDAASMGRPRRLEGYSLRRGATDGSEPGAAEG